MSEEELRTETSGKEECGGHCRGGHSHANHACTECGSCGGCHEEEAGFLLPRVCVSAALFIAALFIGPPWLKTVFFAAAALALGVWSACSWLAPRANVIEIVQDGEKRRAKISSASSPEILSSASRRKARGVRMPQWSSAQLKPVM